MTIHTSKQSTVRKSWQGYLVLGCVINAAIWGTTFLYLKVARPTYISEWALILPSSAPGVSVDLPNIGQANSSSTSAFGSTSLDPRANYEYIATSTPVLTKAAAVLKMPIEEFGEPKVKLLDNTSIMQFQVKGTTPKEAQQKSKALYQALTSQLSLLRVEEIARRDEGVQATLHAAKAKLLQAQQRLSDYKAASGLSFPGQVENLSVNVEQLRRQRSETLAQQRQAFAHLQQLASSLQISPKQASDAFVLQADQVFQQNLKDYSEANASLVVMRSKWGPNHPDIVKEESRQKAAQAALLDRSRSLLGHSPTQHALEYLQLSATDQGSGRISLFRDLVSAQADAQGFTTSVATLDQQIGQLESRLDLLAQRQSVLENLQRDEQTAEAVFASTLAKLDLGKSDIFTAYPLVQMMAQPSIPDAPSTPKPTLIIAGDVLGSCLSSLGLVLLWRRKRTIAATTLPSHVPHPTLLPIEPSLESKQAL
jgi:uncharacterized protein involved in exopolysaccharide biosynthesis